MSYGAVPPMKGRRSRSLTPGSVPVLLIAALVACGMVAAIWRRGPVEDLSAGSLDAGLLDGAPDLIKQALAKTGTGVSDTAAPTDDSVVVKQEKLDEAVLAKKYGGAKAAKKALHGISAAVLHQMAEDVENPDPAEKAAEKAAETALLHPKQAHDAKEAALERKVKHLERVNARLAMHNAPAGDAASAAAAEARAQKVAAAGALAVERKAEALTKRLVTPGDAAMAHAEAVAEAGARGEQKRVEQDTQAMLHDSGSFNLAKMERARAHSLPGVTKSAFGGARRAFNQGRAGAGHLPGIKEDTWPFAAGSFHEAAKKPIPGVNEDDWLSSVFFPKKAAAAGGCYPGNDGKLQCSGSRGALAAAGALASSMGLSDTRVAPKRAPGTGLARLVPQIRKDAEQQRLEDAAAAFAAQMKAQGPAARTQALAQGAVLADARAGDALLRKAQEFSAKGRTQVLERAGAQCSTLLDCISGAGGVVPHHTHPTIGAALDLQVHSPEESRSRNALADAFRGGMRPWRLVSRWPFEAGDRSVAVGSDELAGTVHRPMSPKGKIARPSATSRTGQKADVAARPVSSGATYARERRALRSRALAAEQQGTLAQLAQRWEAEDAPARAAPGVRARKQALVDSGSFTALLHTWETQDARKGARRQSLAEEESPALPPGDGSDGAAGAEAGEEGAEELPVVPSLPDNRGARNYESTQRLCKTGVNCNTEFLGAEGQDREAPIAYAAAHAALPPWTPYQYGNSPTGWTPRDVRNYAPDFADLPDWENARRARVPGQMAGQQLRAMAPVGSPRLTEVLPPGAGAAARPAGAAPAPALAEAGEEAAVEREEATDMANAARLESEARAEAGSDARLSRAGVNVDSGWLPFPHEHVWGVDRRGEHPDRPGLLSAGDALPADARTPLDGFERSDGGRGAEAARRDLEALVSPVVGAWEAHVAPPKGGRAKPAIQHGFEGGGASGDAGAAAEGADADADADAPDAAEGEGAAAAAAEVKSLAQTVFGDDSQKVAAAREDREAAAVEQAKVDGYLASRFGAGAHTS